MCVGVSCAPPHPPPLHFPSTGSVCGDQVRTLHTYRHLSLCTFCAWGERAQRVPGVGSSLRDSHLQRDEHAHALGHFLTQRDAKLPKAAEHAGRRVGLATSRLPQLLDRAVVVFRIEEPRQHLHIAHLRLQPCAKRRHNGMCHRCRHNALHILPGARSRHAAWSAWSRWRQKRHARSRWSVLGSRIPDPANALSSRFPSNVTTCSGAMAASLPSWPRKRSAKHCRTSCRCC